VVEEIAPRTQTEIEEEQDGGLQFNDVAGRDSLNEEEREALGLGPKY